MTEYLLHIFNRIIRWLSCSLSLSKGRSRVAISYGTDPLDLPFDYAQGGVSWGESSGNEYYEN